MNKICIFFFFIGSIGFSQTLEESIYVASETFINNQNETSLQHLNTQESTFKTQVKTKEEQLALVFLQCNKGYYLNQNLKQKDAISSYEEALKRFNDYDLSKLSDFDMIENCLKPLGNLYTKTGNYTNAVSTINQYIFLAEKNKNVKHQASGAINLAKLYQTIGKDETVIKIIENALKLPNISIEQKQLLQGIKTTSLVALKNYDDATSLNDSTTSSKFIKYKNTYVIELQKSNYKRALISFKKAKEHLTEAHLTTRDLAKFYVEEAQLHYLLKNSEDALKSLQLATKTLLPNFDASGLPNKNDLYAENTFIDIFDLYASLETNTKIKLKSFDLGFYVSSLLQDTWTSQEAKIWNETNNRIRSESCIYILFNKYNETKDKTLLFKAFQYSENNKASVLKEIFLKRIRLQNFPNDSLLIKELNLLNEQEHVTNLLIKEQLGPHQASKINRLSKALSSISFQLKALKISINKKYPDTDDVRFKIKNLQARLLKDDAVLIAYFFGRNTIYQFTLSDKNIALHAIPLNVDTKQKITNFIHLFDDAYKINNDINNFTHQAFNVFEILKLRSLSTYKNIVLIPDGLLNFVPFEALLSSKTNTSLFSKMPFLVKNHNIAYNSSALFYLKDVEKNKNNQLLGFFPVFENSNQTLKYSKNEANAIKEEMDATLFMNSKASKSNFIKNAANYGILHVSTHASSGDFVKPASISFYDDTMFLNELYSLRLSSNLVVLSACETGIGKLYKGEGSMSIARGFQYAGAERLLFSLWQINDLSTSQVMKSFYKNYNTNQSAFAANKLSKIEYLENETISNAKKSPYYWSAFVYYGSIENEKSKNTIYYITFGVLITLIALFLMFKLKKHDTNTPRISS